MAYLDEANTFCLNLEAQVLVTNGSEWLEQEKILDTHLSRKLHFYIDYNVGDYEDEQAICKARKFLQ